VRRRVEVASCDQCGSEDRVESFRITSATQTVHLDLCVVHREPLVQVMDIGRAAHSPRHEVIAVDYEGWLKERMSKDV
jgi:hypothetical protein